MKYCSLKEGHIDGFVKVAKNARTNSENQLHIPYQVFVLVCPA